LRTLVALAALLAAIPAAAGTVGGTVQVVDKGGRKTADRSDVVVWVEGAKGRIRPQTQTASITMRNKAFAPHVVVVPVGGSVQFPNADPIFHNVFSVSGENRFDLELYKRPKTGTQVFQHPGLVRVYCNIHPQMSAFVMVRDNPYFAKAAADGTYTIEGVPAGTYTLHAWHERGGEGTVSVTVPAEGSVKGDLTLDASTFKAAPHKNKFGKDYESSDTY